MANDSTKNPLSQERKTELIEALSELPETWQLTPVDGNKRPYKKAWQSEILDRKAIISEIQSGRAMGYGLITGIISGDIVAVDEDGPAAVEYRKSLGEIPHTVSFTSGIEKRRQSLLRMPEIYRDKVQTRKFNTHIKDENGKDQNLELRWDGLQSVLPPAVHPTTDRYTWINGPDTPIAEAPLWLIEQMISEPPVLQELPPPIQFPTQHAQQPPRYENITIPVPANIPLKSCLAKSSRDLLNGVSEGGRNDAAAKLARDLIGTVNYLNSIGQNFDGDAQSLLADFNRCCNPPLPQKEIDTVWKSASRDNPTPACKSDGVDNCVRAWYWNHYLKRDSTQNKATYQTNGTAALKPQSNIIPHPAVQRLSENDIENKLRKLIEDDPKNSEVKKQLNALCYCTGRPLSAIKEYYEALKKEHQSDTEKPQQAETLKEIARLRTNTLNPIDYLIGDNGKLARQLIETAEAMPTSASWLFTTLIAASGSCIKAESKIMINPKSGYKQSAIFRTLIIANTGAKKTPAQSAILDPLFKMELEEADKFNESKVEYEEELRQYESKAKKERADEPPPKPPIRKRYILGDATPEAIADIHGQNPDGFLVYRDEGSGFYTSLNKYRSGKGDDCELDLSEFNGKPLIVDRKSGSTCIANPHICRTGSTQTATFKNLMGNFDDAAGYWARWLIDISPAPPSFIDLSNDAETGLSETLTDLYQALASQDSRIYGLAMPAKALWQEFQHELTRELLATNITGLQNVYPKLETYFGRFCLWLHLINAALAGEEPLGQIQPDTVRAAIQLTRYYTHQWILFHSTQNPEVADLTEQMLAIHEFAKRKGKAVEPRDIKAGIRKFKDTPMPQVRGWCEVLGNTAGYGYWDGKVYSPIKNVDNVDKMLTVCQHTQNHTPYIVDGIVDNVDKNFTLSKNTPIEETGIPSKKDTSIEMRQHCQQNAEPLTPPSVDDVDKPSTNRQQCQHFEDAGEPATPAKFQVEEAGEPETLTPSMLTDVDTQNDPELEMGALLKEAVTRKDRNFA